MTLIVLVVKDVKPAIINIIPKFKKTKESIIIEIKDLKNEYQWAMGQHQWPNQHITRISG